MSERNYQRLLKSELEKLKIKNSSFSQRALAQKLDISPSQLSQLISGKRSLTYKTALKIFDFFDLKSEERRNILREVSVIEKENPAVEQEQFKLSDYEISMICSWEYFAVLSLSEVSNNVAKPNWISERLNISLEKASDVFSLLLKLQLIAISGESFCLSKGNVDTTDGIPSQSIRNYHKSAIAKAVSYIDTIPTEERIFSALTLAANSSDLKRIHKILNSFKKRLYRTIKSSEERDTVYQMTVQFVPLDHQGASSS